MRWIDREREREWGNGREVERLVRDVENERQRRTTIVRGPNQGVRGEGSGPSEPERFRRRRHGRNGRRRRRGRA